MYAPFRKLPANTHGKDYVVGDLHGCYPLLVRLLNAVNFDKSKDRLFSVGDLIDRGPESLRCLELLQEPWFFAVQGNHELMMLNFFYSYIRDGRIDDLEDVNGTGFLDYGGEWVEREFISTEYRMSVAFNRGLALALDMPLMWIVGDGDNRFHVIHAELVRTKYERTEQAVWLDSDIDQWLEQQKIPSDVEDRLYWGRTLMSSQLVSKPSFGTQAGLSPTFCGHTYDVMPRQALSHICLDTGAFVPYLSNAGKDDPSKYGLLLFAIKEKRWVMASSQTDQLRWGALKSQRLRSISDEETTYQSPNSSRNAVNV